MISLPAHKYEVFTPERAAEMLRDSERIRNRPINQRRVEELANCMTNGTWFQNVDSIRLDPDGHLIDGQHRLSAVVLSGKTQIWDVVRVEREAMQVIDGGKSRTPSDRSMLATGIHVPDPSAHFAALGWLWRLYRGGSVVKDSKGPTHAEIHEMFLTHHQAIAPSIAFVRTKPIRVLTKANGALGALHYLTTQADPAKAARFWSALSDGTGLVKGHPVLTLRERFIATRATEGRTSRSGALPTWITVAFVIKAWNAYCLGRPLTIMRMQLDEPMPEIHGWTRP